MLILKIKENEEKAIFLDSHILVSLRSAIFLKKTLRASPAAYCNNPMYLFIYLYSFPHQSLSQSILLVE